MDSFLQLIKQRKSCRRFQNRKVEADKKEILISSALLAPTSKNSRPWEFLVIEDQKTLEALSFSKPHGSKLLKYAPLAIIVMADPEKSDVWVEDTSIASIYLQLAAEDLKLGSCWVQIRERSHSTGIKSEDYIRRILNIPEHLRITSIIALGYKEDELDIGKDHLFLDEKVHTEVYGEE